MPIQLEMENYDGPPSVVGKADGIKTRFFFSPRANRIFFWEAKGGPLNIKGDSSVNELFTEGQARTFEFNSIYIGSLSLRKIEVFFISDEFHKSANVGFVGEVGYNLLSEVEFLSDSQNRKIIIFRYEKKTALL